MADILALRAALAAAEANLSDAQGTLEQLTANLNDPDVPAAIRARFGPRVQAQQKVVARLSTDRDNAKAAYGAAVQADPLHGVDAGLPLVLLPIRIETAFLPGAAGAGVDLVVRVYPDDIHVDTHEPELTAAELAVATAYWQSVWGAGVNQDRLDGAWRAVLSRLKPNRAAWAVHVTTPATPRPPTETPSEQPQPVPPPPTVATRPGSFTRAARSMLLPDHWRIVGFTDGSERFYAEGSPIPDSLDVSFGPPGTGANDSDLPFDNNSRWLVDLDAAIAVGMAIRIPLADSSTPIDQVFVLGINTQVGPQDSADRLQAAFQAHQYTNGLGFLPPGSPTNNTSASRSAWVSAPAPPTPTDVDVARAQYQPASSQNAALAAKALGMDGSPSLSVADFGLKDQQTEVMVIQRHLWNALGAKALSQLYMRWDIPPGGSPSQGGWHLHDDPASTAMLKEHMLGWVRSRGVLPVLRVGNQPYGLLPATSLTDWVAAADDTTQTLLTWLKTFRPYFMAAVAGAPRIGVSGQDPDSAITNVLQRVPVAQDIMLRADGNPFSATLSGQPLPPAPIPGLPVSSELFLSAPNVDASRMLIPVVSDALGDHGLLMKWAELFNDSIAVLKGAKTYQEWVTAYQPIFGQQHFPGAPPADLFTSLLQEAFNDPMSSGGSTSVVGFIVLAACSYGQNQHDPAFQRLVQMRLPEADAFVAQFAQLVDLLPAAYDPVVRELLDVVSHRFDAWIVSLATRRLDKMRAAKPAGVVIGAYGWIEDLSPRTDLAPVTPPPAGFGSALVGQGQTYIHAPSMHHAATAAVLRAGFDSHAHADALAVNLESRRVRLATWLAEGVGHGQTVGALLGYRFERGLHEAGLDSLIEGLRQAHPLPLLSGKDEGGTGAREAIAARNVVDGLDLYRKQADVRAQLPQVGAPLDDLIDAMDAFGDLLLAESVHHLVGGNPLRAGLAADTLGRGDPPPERYDFARTPRGGRPLTWQIGTLLSASWSAPVAGWRADRPRAQVEPHVEAWAGAMLGNAGLWRIDCSVAAPGAAESSVRIGLDALGLCALDVVCESGGSGSILQLRIQDAVRSNQPLGSVVTLVTTPAADGALGFGALQGFTTRIRALLSQVQPLGPQHVQGADTPPTLGVDLSELEARLAILQTTLATAAGDLATAIQSLDAAGGTPGAGDAVRAARGALLRLVDLGVTSAYPPEAAGDDPAAFTAISAQAAAVLATISSLPVAPAPPSADAGAIAAWLRQAADYVQGVMGRTIPLLPCFLLSADSAYAAAFAPAAAPVGADPAAVTAWLRRLARVRPQVMALHDILLASSAITGSEPGLTTAQLPVEPGAQWIGLPYGDRPPPKARLALVVSTPAPVTPSTPFCGMLFDNWTEQLPGLTSVADPAKGYETAEVTGVAFSVEGPEAYPPQAILLAIPPDPAAPWSFDTLFDVVQETLDLAKIRTIDLGDLPRLGRVLPAVHTGASLDDVINAAGHNP